MVSSSTRSSEGLSPRDWQGYEPIQDGADFAFKGDVWAESSVRTASVGTP